LRHTQEETVTLKEIVESERLLNPLNTSLDYACKYTKCIQELLIILQQTRPCITDLGTKLMAVTPKNNDKKIRLTNHIPSTGNTPVKTTSSTNIVSKTPVLSSTGVNLLSSASGSQPQGNTKNDRLQRAPSKAKKNKLEDHNKTVRPSLNKKKSVVDTKAISSVTTSKLNVNVDLKCAMCNGWHNLFSVGQFCDSDLEVAFRQHTCFIRNLDGVDLLTGSLGNNLYTLSLQDMMASLPICLLSKASKTKSWLWHHRLSHLNFGAINHLARQGLVRGLRKLKFEKDHLCSACAMGKSMKKSHKPKYEDTNQEKLYLLHMDLCGLMRIESVNGKKYILDLLFQPMFDELLNPPPSVDHQVPEVIAPIADVIPPVQADLTGSPSLTLVDQDAPSPMESKTYKDALTQSCWIEAMQEELNEFERLEVWELVPRPDKVMVITLKWIYKVKLDEMGGILKNKARLVARGYRQEEGIDFEENDIDLLLAMDEALVPYAQRLRIGRSNFLLLSDIKSKESTLQLVYDVLCICPFFKAFLVTADVPEIYMQEFWATATVHHYAIRFKMDNKKHIMNLESFRDMLHICLRIHGQSFDEPPFKEEILAFICFLRHSAAIRTLTDVNINKLYQPWRSFTAIINKCLTGKSSGHDSLRLSQAQILSDTSITPPPAAAVSPRLTASTKGKQTAKASKAKSLSALSEVAMTEAQQLKLVTKRSMQQTHISQVSGSNADEGTGSIPGVSAAPTDEFEEELSWNSTDDEGADNEGKDGDDDEEDEGIDGKEGDGDDYDEDDDGEEGNDDDDDQEVIRNDDKDDEKDDEEEGGDDEHGHDKEEYDEETRDKESFDPIPQTPKNSNDKGNGEEDLGLNVGREEGHIEEEEEDEDELYRDVNINQGRYGLTNGCTDSNLSGPSSYDCTNYDSFTIATITTTSQEPILPTIRINEAVKVAVQIQLDRLRDEAQRENDEFLKSVDENMQKIIKEHVKEQVKVQVSKILPRIKQAVNEQLEAEVLTRSSHSSKTSYVVAADLSEMENLYNALVEAYESDKIILNTYGETVTLKRRRDDDADKDEEPFAGLDRGSKRHKKGKEPESASAPTKTATRSAGRSIQPWISELAKQSDSRSSFNELMDTPLDFSNFLINRLKVDTLTLELLAGPTYELMKGSCKSLVELEYHLEEVFKATTDQLDWVNPEGQQYPHNLLNPLPLILNNRGRRVIPFEHFINNDLEYLRGGASIRKYTTSITKTKAADYKHIKWIEDLVPRTMWIKEPIGYDKHALWGVSYWGRKLLKPRYNSALLTTLKFVSNSVNKPVNAPFKSTNVNGVNQSVSRTGGNRSYRFTQKELEEKRAKNQCFYCDHKYFPGHKCSGQLYSLEVVSENDIELIIEGEGEVFKDFVEEVVKTDSTPQISLNAISCLNSFQTKRVKGMLGKHTLHILVDYGSTHNFLDLKTAKNLGHKFESTITLQVYVANGQNMISCYECKNFQWSLQGETFTSDVIFDQEKNNLQAQQKKKMVKTSSSSENGPCCSKACKKNTEIPNSKITELTNKFCDAKNMIYHYKLGLAQVEDRLPEYRNQELKYCEKIRVLKFKVESRADCIESLTKELELIKKEKEGLDSKLAGFQTALKDLDSLLESQRLDMNKEGLGYSAVPPPPAQIYSPPKKDLSWTGLLEFADDIVTDYSWLSPVIESTSDDVQNKNPSVTKTEASPSTISSKPFFKFLKPADSPTVVKTKKKETVMKPSIKYAKLYIKPSKKSTVRGNQRN
nr:integrase, catalytic region, zinc finger, CCHC-type, peptidase aspartic, catalytic [Tanacetum cinerariifolium]